LLQGTTNCNFDEKIARAMQHEDAEFEVWRVKGVSSESESF
jgi:hypothetical protein